MFAMARLSISDFCEAIHRKAIQPASHGDAKTSSAISPAIITLQMDSTAI
jgi:hypothetical protein